VGKRQRIQNDIHCERFTTCFGEEVDVLGVSYVLSLALLDRMVGGSLIILHDYDHRLRIKCPLQCQTM